MSDVLVADFSSFKGFIFDCDGVIIDSFEANAAYYNHILNHFGLPSMTAEQALYVHSASCDASLDYILPPEYRQAADDYRMNLDYRFVVPYLRLEPGLREVLLLMREKGYKLAVCTNRTSTMHFILDHFGLNGFFDPIIQAKDVSLPKPHPEGLQHILTEWRQQPDEVAFIGDSHIDQQTAAAAGVPFWAYKNPGLAARVHVTDFPKLHADMLR